MTKLRICTALFTGLALLGLTAHAQDALRVNGANAMWAPLNKNLTALEAATGTKVAFVPNTAGRGLADLAEGKCDIAMVTSSVAGAAEAANQEKPGAVADVAAFKSEEIGTETIVFVVNKANSVAKLTQGQVKDLLTGKITNWKDVGGGDLPVVLVRVSATAGPHMAIEKDILQGAKIPDTAKAMKGPKDVPNVVAQVPGSIGYLGSNNANDSVKIIATDYTIKMSMMLVTKGEPTATQRKFIDAAKAVMAAK